MEEFPITVLVLEFYFLFLALWKDKTTVLTVNDYLSLVIALHHQAFTQSKGIVLLIGVI